MAFEGNPAEDAASNVEREREHVAALRREHAHVTEPAKKAELAARLARLGHDPNENSLTGNPVPERQSPPKATAAEVRDYDVNRMAAEARGTTVGADKHMPIGVESDKLPGDQEMFDHGSGERVMKSPGEQEHGSTDASVDNDEVSAEHESAPDVEQAGEHAPQTNEVTGVKPDTISPRVKPRYSAKNK